MMYLVCTIHTLRFGYSSTKKATSHTNHRPHFHFFEENEEAPVSALPVNPIVDNLQIVYWPLIVDQCALYYTYTTLILFRTRPNHNSTSKNGIFLPKSPLTVWPLQWKIKSCDILVTPYQRKRWRWVAVALVDEAEHYSSMTRYIRVYQMDE